MEDNTFEFEGLDKEHMKTMSSCLTTLTKVGYAVQFKVTEEGLLQSLTTKDEFKPDEVKITNFYRFEGESDPSDNAILYAIKTNTGEKGTLIDAFGIYNEPLVDDFLKEVETITKRAHDKD
jgi:hypothetical protein